MTAQLKGKKCCRRTLYSELMETDVWEDADVQYTALCELM